MKRAAKSIALILTVVMILALFPVTASAASYKPGKVKITSCKVSKVSKSTNTATVTIKWKRVSKATGYWVYQRNEKGKWVRLKKLGKSYVGIKIRQVYAGQNAFRVRAVRKVKGKVYKGKMSNIKSVFITSPLTLEELYKLESLPTDASFTDEYGSITTYGVKGKVIYWTKQLPTDFQRPTDAEIEAYVNDLKPDLLADIKNARLYGGVKGCSAIVGVQYGNEAPKTTTIKE